MATGLLLFNEVIDDKHLGLWLKSALESKEANAAVDRVKSEMIRTYIQTWKFIYSIYHGKCLARSLANLYGGAGDIDPPTCFVSNSPLCAVCTHSDDICQWSVDIRSFLLVLLKTVKQICDTGLQKVTKILLISVLLQSNENYVRSFDALQDMLDESNTCWGSGLYVNAIRVSKPSWHKVIYVAVHLGYLDVTFDFRPYESHFEVHRKYLLSASGEDFLRSPFTVMSVDPQSNVVDIILGVLQNAPFRKSYQNRGNQLLIKPRVMAALENTWIEGSIEKLKFLGLGLDVQDDICL